MFYKLFCTKAEFYLVLARFFFYLKLNSNFFPIFHPFSATICELSSVCTVFFFRLSPFSLLYLRLFQKKKESPFVLLFFLLHMSFLYLFYFCHFCSLFKFRDVVFVVVFLKDKFSIHIFLVQNALHANT